MTDRAPGPEEIWDRFVDALDRAGQAGSPAGVVVPHLGMHELGGKRFGDLSKDDVKVLARTADALARRGTTILTLWEDMRQRSRDALKAPGKKQRRPARS